MENEILFMLSLGAIILLVVSLAIMYYIIKQAVKNANEESFQRTNALLSAILIQSGGDPDEAKTKTEKIIELNKNIEELNKRRWRNEITEEEFKKSMADLENQKSKLK